MRAMNLLPVEERGGARAGGSTGRLTAVHGIAGVGAVVAIGLLATWGVAQKDTSDAKQAEAAAVAQSAAGQAQVARLAPVVAFDARRTAREKDVLALAAGRTDWAGVLRATAGSLPSSVSVTTLKLAAADAAATSTASAPTPVGLAGSGSVTLSVCADTQPRVATTLRRFRALPQVSDVALSQTSRTAKAAGGTSGQGCTGVQADAALGLSEETVIDGAAAGTAATTGADPAGTTSTPGTTTPSAATTTGTSR